MFDKLYKGLVPRIIKRSRSYIVFSAVLFVLAGIVGWMIVSGGQMPIMLQQVMENFAGMVEGASSPFGLSLSIFIHNVRTGFFAVAFGWLLGLVPLVSIWSNGQIIGMVAKYMEVNAGVPLFKTVLSLFPHGLLELPAFIISAAVALRTGWILLMCIFKKREWKAFLTSFLESVMIMVLVVVPLFLVAAFIEGFISPAVLNWLIR